MSARLIGSYGLGCSSEQSNVRFAGLQLPFYHHRLGCSSEQSYVRSAGLHFPSYHRAYGKLPFVHSGTTLTLSLVHFEPLREALAACLPVLKNISV
jgi:hypothetical protein